MVNHRDDDKGSSETFQGLPIIPLEWNDEVCEAVQGAIVLRTTPHREFSLADIESRLDMKVRGIKQPDELGIGVIYAEESVSQDRLIAAGEKLHPEVLWAEPMLIDRGTLIPDDDMFLAQWNLAHIKAEKAWDLWHGDPSTVVIAVLDSGIPIENGKLSHPDLNNAGRFFLGEDVYNNDLTPADDHGHGTHVVGIAAATTNNGDGVAGLWPGSVLVVKVFNNANLGSGVTFYDGVKAAVRFANENGKHLIINYSGGGCPSQTKRVAIEHAAANGALIVAAAGNENGNAIIFPAAFALQYSNLMAIGAVDDLHQIPGFASRGPEMTVVAPGVYIVSSLPNYDVTLTIAGKSKNYDLLSGTSQATPLAAALAALVWSQWPKLSAIEVRDKIIQSAVPLGSFNEYGHGLINAEAALT